MLKNSLSLSPEYLERAGALAWPILAAASLVACGTSAKSDAETPRQSVALAVTVPEDSTAPVDAEPETTGGLSFSDGTRTLTVSSAEVVLREIQFKRLDEGVCGAADLADDNGGSSTSGLTSADHEGGEDHSGGSDASGGTDDSGDGADDRGHHSGEDGECDEDIEVGPLLLDLPLDGSVVREVEALVPADVYRAVAFRVHKVEDDGSDQAFLEAHPGWSRISIRVEGTYNDAPYLFTSDLNAKQQIVFPEPLEVTEAEPALVTLSVDVGAWFVSAGGALVDPASGLKGGANEGLIKDNIKSSIRNR
ncbi:MAG: hypothetical protein HY903_03860 [Deltaproteobacteria bacterium]|nr:hypothetical protein [Deltaproteobacteria bacterium]